MPAEEQPDDHDIVAFAVAWVTGLELARARRDKGDDLRRAAEELGWDASMKASAIERRLHASVLAIADDPTVVSSTERAMLRVLLNENTIEATNEHERGWQLKEASNRRRRIGGRREQLLAAIPEFEGHEEKWFHQTQHWPLADRVGDHLRTRALGVEAPSDPDATAASEAEPDRDRRGARIGAAAIGLATLAVVALWILTRSGGDDATEPGTSTTTAPCTIGPGEADPAVTRQDLERIRRLRSEVRDKVPPGACANEPVSYLALALVQRFDVPGQIGGVIVISPNDDVVWLSTATWESYRQIISGDHPEQSPAFAGYPIRVETSTDPDALIVRLDKGGRLVSVDDTNEAYWMPQEVLEQWDATGGLLGSLGLPMSNPFIDAQTLSFRQDYVGGYAIVDAPAPARSPISIHVVADRGARIDALGDLTDSILQQAQTQTAWYIDDRGRRRWIPTVDVYTCLDGDRRKRPERLPGYEVATLPLGPPMTCEAGT